MKIKTIALILWIKPSKNTFVWVWDGIFDANIDVP